MDEQIFEIGDEVIITMDCACCKGKTGVVVSLTGNGGGVIKLETGNRVAYTAEQMIKKEEEVVNLGEYAEEGW